MQHFPVIQACWKGMLHTKFKNLRCPGRADKAGIAVLPPAKKPKKVAAFTMGTLTDSDYAEHERHVEYLKQTYNSKSASYLACRFC